jgi:hypothetical protein
MSDEPLTNAAVEWLRQVYEVANVTETPPTSAPITDDFAYTDRRTGRGFSYGSLDASGWRRLVTETWRVGSGRPAFSITEVIAVRGQWSAAVAELHDFGEDMTTRQINCFQLDPESRLMRRSFDFDLGDRDAAIAELDRMHDEIGE